MKKRRKIATCGFITTSIALAIFCMPFLWVSAYSILFGQRDIINTAKEITANETNSIANLNNIADWLNSHITYDAHGFYFYPVPPLFLFRKVPADSA